MRCTTTFFWDSDKKVKILSNLVPISPRYSIKKLENSETARKTLFTDGCLLKIEKGCTRDKDKDKGSRIYYRI